MATTPHSTYDSTPAGGQQPPPLRTATPTPTEQGLFEKYGFQLPAAGVFATAVAVGTVKKYIINDMIYDRLIPNDPTTGTTPGPDDTLTPTPALPTQPETGISPADNSASAIESFDASPYGGGSGGANSGSMAPLQEDGGVVAGIYAEDGGYDDTLNAEAADLDGVSSAPQAEWEVGVDAGSVAPEVDAGSEAEVVSTLFEDIVNIF